MSDCFRFTEQFGCSSRTAQPARRYAPADSAQVFHFSSSFRQMSGRFVLLIAALLGLEGCQRVASIGTPSSAEHSWKSEHHPAEFAWSAPWVRLKAENTSDSASELIQAFVHRPGGMACLIRVTSDVSQAKVSNTDFWSALKEQQFSADPQTILVHEGTALLRGRGFHQMRFETSNDRQNRTCVDLYNRRDGERNWSVRISFPYDESFVASGKLPPEFSQLKVTVGGPTTVADLEL